MRPDIYGSLKNAVDRGTPLEKAVKSMIGSGYKESEVREAAKAVESGMIPSFGGPEPKELSKKELKRQQKQENKVQKQVQPTTKNQSTPQAPQQKSAQKLPTSQPPKPKYIGPGKRNSTIKIIVLAVILVILLALLGASILFKDQIVDFLTTIFG